MILRIDPALADEVKRHLGDGYFTTAVEDGLRWWLKRAKRQRGVDPLAKHLAPPAAREIAARAGGDPGSHPMPFPPNAPVLGGKKG